MRFLVTGITGFAGRHLLAELLRRGHQVEGIARHPGAAISDTIVHQADVADQSALEEILEGSPYDGIFHLAGAANPALSLSDPETAVRSNFLATLRLFAAVQKKLPECRVAWVGSGAVYGAVDVSQIPIDEETPFRPLTPYAVAKAAADLAAYKAAKADGLNVIRLRPFNHVGPGQGSGFVCSDLAQQVVKISSGQQENRIETGNLDVRRDFCDVRDVVKAYIAAWERGEIGQAYNVCSGVARSPREILDDFCRIAEIRPEVEMKEGRRRPNDVPEIVGKSDKLKAISGWVPEVPWERTLVDIIEYWRQRQG